MNNLVQSTKTIPETQSQCIPLEVDRTKTIADLLDCITATSFVPEEGPSNIPECSTVPKAEMWRVHTQKSDTMLFAIIFLSDAIAALEEV